MPNCRCGCGEQTKGTFAPGHQWRYRREQLEPPNPSGLCQCGCGGKTAIADRTMTRLGHVAGEPVPFLIGHGARKTNRWVEEDRGYKTPCWIWQLAIDRDGYGRGAVEGRSTRGAYRYTYEEKYGPIPEGLQIDHLCRVKTCVNPDHLEAVTCAENVRRSHEARRLDPQVSRDIDAVSLE